MNITLFIFEKKINSTKRPSVLSDTYIEVSAVLKDNCSILNPTFLISWTGTGLDVTPSRYNYCYISDFHRYYWATNFVSINNGLWEISYECDVLASFRTEIGNSNCYVLRADSATNADGLITDSLYPAKAKPNIDISDITLSYSTDFMQGNFIVGIINAYYSNYNVNQGAVTYYGMTMAQFGSFKNALLNDISWLQSGNSWDLDISESTAKALFNPFQYVTSVMWMPFSALELGMLSGYLTDVYIGWWKMNSSIKAYRLNSATINTGLGNGNITANNSIINNNTVDSKYLYLNYPPYSRYIVHLPPFGDFELDGQIAGECLGASTSYTVNLRGDVDLVTGKALLYSAQLDSNLHWQHDGMIETSCQIGVPVQIAQITTNTGAGIVTALGYASQAINAANPVNLMLNPAGAVATGLHAGAAGIYDSLAAISPRMSKSDSNGSIAAIVSKRYVLSEHFNTVDRSPSEQGYPVCKSLDIDTISGFIKTAACDITIAEASKTELEKIRSTMDSGFYFE